MAHWLCGCPRAPPGCPDWEGGEREEHEGTGGGEREEHEGTGERREGRERNMREQGEGDRGKE